MRAIDQHADRNAAVAQEALELLMRARLPNIKHAALVRFGIRMELDEKLISARLAELAHRPVGRQRHLLLRDLDCKLFGKLRPAGGPGNKARFRAENAGKERPGIGQDGRAFFAFARKTQPDRLGIDGGLSRGDEFLFADDVRAEHEADRADVQQPFRQRIDGCVDDRGHAVCGQR
jgi:hypothetical protein